MGAKDQKSLLELLLKDSHIVHCIDASQKNANHNKTEFVTKTGVNELQAHPYNPILAQ